MKDVLEIALSEIRIWSKSFYHPILLLPKEVQKASSSLYLCLRAIDEIEDHEKISKNEKIYLLEEISNLLCTPHKKFNRDCFSKLFLDYKDLLPSVTQELSDWLNLAPEPIAPRIWEATSAMALRMSYWVKKEFEIKTLEDLEAYAYSVGACVGLALSDIWAWHDNTQVNRFDAINYGLLLQFVNIINGKKEDAERGVNYYPEGWDNKNMISYILSIHDSANTFVKAIKDPLVREANLQVLNTAQEVMSKIK